MNQLPKWTCTCNDKNNVLCYSLSMVVYYNVILIKMGSGKSQGSRTYIQKKSCGLSTLREGKNARIDSTIFFYFYTPSPRKLSVFSKKTVSCLSAGFFPRSINALDFCPPGTEIKSPTKDESSLQAADSVQRVYTTESYASCSTVITTTVAFISLLLLFLCVFFLEPELAFNPFERQAGCRSKRGHYYSVLFVQGV